MLISSSPKTYGLDHGNCSVIEKSEDPDSPITKLKNHCVSSQKVNDHFGLTKSVSINTRSYSKGDEVNRSLDIRHYNQTLLLEPSYKRVANDNLWNERKALSPR